MSRRRLFDLYTEISERVEEVKHLIRTSSPQEYERARAYWIASLSVGLSSAEYCTHNPTMEQFLIDEGIMDDCSEFIENEN